MGNSIYGQAPSTVFAVVRDNILNESHEHYIFNTEKYDLLKELSSLSEKEKEYFEDIINYYKSKKSNDGTQIDHLIKFNKIIDEFAKELVRLELEEDLNGYESANKCCKIDDNDDNQDEFTTCTVPINDPFIIDKQFDDEYPGGMKTIACDTKLLDLTYGLLQLNLADDLLKDLVIDETLSTPERNSQVFNLVKERWNNMTKEEKDAKNMQYRTIEGVKPCTEALQNWLNWGVM